MFLKHHNIRKIRKYKVFVKKKNITYLHNSIIITSYNNDHDISHMQSRVCLNNNDK